MKGKKTVILATSLVLSLTLAGCLSPALPKDAYVKGVNTMEKLHTYEKTSTLDVDIEPKGLWKESEQVFFSLLNKSTLNVSSVTDHSKGQTASTLHLIGGFAFYPIDTTLDLLYDEKNQKTYVDGNDLSTALTLFNLTTQASKEKWLEVGTSKKEKDPENVLRFLLESDAATLLAHLSEEKFTRIAVDKKEKEEGVRDIVSATLTQNELQSLLPSTDTLSSDWGIEQVTLTAYFNRKGQTVKEKVETKLTYKKGDKALTVHAAMHASYEGLNKAVTINSLPSARDIMPLKDALTVENQHEIKTEKP